MQHRRSDQSGDRNKACCGRLRRPRRLGRPRARLPPRLAAAAPALPSGSARLRRVTVSVPAAAASAAGARAGVLSKPAAPAPPRCLRPRCKPLIGCRGIASLVRPPARVSPTAPISRGGKAAAYKILVLSNWLRQLPTKQNILYNWLGRERPALGGLVHHITILLNLMGHSPIKFCEQKSLSRL